MENVNPFSIIYITSLSNGLKGFNLSIICYLHFYSKKISILHNSNFQNEKKDGPTETHSPNALPAPGP
jgi:hypothetical protein